MDPNGNVYATEGEVPRADVERLRRAMEEGVGEERAAALEREASAAFAELAAAAKGGRA